MKQLFQISGFPARTHHGDTGNVKRTPIAREIRTIMSSQVPISGMAAMIEPVSFVGWHF
jgi:hypothetical protein